MTFAFPYRLEPDAGGVAVQFIDVPEAHTFGGTEADAGGDSALDCLIAALGGYVKLGREIPTPSPGRGRPVAILPPLVSAKLALYDAMRTQRITRTELARRLGLQENAVRRLLDLDHRTDVQAVLISLLQLRCGSSIDAGTDVRCYTPPTIS